MDHTAQPELPAQTPPPISPAGAKPDRNLTNLTALLENLDEAQSAQLNSPRARSNASNENQLIQVRLGIASSLFLALRAKDVSTASHSLRVALGCSSWSMARSMADQQRDEIEVAALLHDVGKIGVPDHVLLKPGALTDEESAIMDRHRQVGLDILRGCCASQEILDVVHYSSAWFDGSVAGYDRSGTELPLGARMLAIADAFDSMTTDHVYRRAMSRDRAISELFEFSGRQFDPDLVRDFCTLQSGDRAQLDGAVVRRWLQQLLPESTDGNWRLGDVPGLSASGAPDNLFFEQLLDNMYDAVVFVDAALRILLWNNGAERLTGIPAQSVRHKHWTPSLIGMCDENNHTVCDTDCPLAHAVQTGARLLRRWRISSRDSRPVSVNVHAVPVIGSDGTTHGAALHMHDASSETTLEERVQSLHEKSTLDPLTRIANRAEFDRSLTRFVKTHLEHNLPCSLIMCDIDHFKRTNDNYGHQAGDEVIVNFASLLKRCCRPGDLVARYGGEEFVMLCADCDNATATRRAEQLRRELSAIPQTMLNGKSITASFGVTEIQSGDTPHTMLRRADRALLMAKDQGRNRVVQLGTGLHGHEKTKRSRNWWPSWLGGRPSSLLLERDLVTTVPLNVVAEKIKGFVADHHAEIVSIDRNRLVVRIDGPSLPMVRRLTDRAVPFIVELDFVERRADMPRPDGNGHDSVFLRTVVHVTIRPKRNRDRRRHDANQRAIQLLVSLKSYLMAQELQESPFTEKGGKKQDGVLGRAKQALTPWRDKKEEAE